MILAGAEGSLLYGEKVVLLGDNGSGKTTLFKLITNELEPDEGAVELGARTEIGYLAQQEQVADNKLTVLEYFQTEGSLEQGEARNVLAKYLFYGADVFKPLGMLSGGEWSRLRLALLVRRKPNLLLLDEPTNHLDMASREALEEALEDYPGTVLAISHDRYFINRLARRVWELSQGRITAFLGNYDDYAQKREHRSAEESDTEGYSRHLKSNLHRHPAKVSDNSSVERSNERRREQLEREIAAVEADLARADEELQRLDCMGDTIQLESKWREREEMQARLDTLLELWMELPG